MIADVPKQFLSSAYIQTVYCRGMECISQLDSMNAVFEAVVNAMAHRDYFIYGSRIRLHLFSDRLKIFSLGTLIP
ncbi:hypothetical protein ABO04_02655 [Nitrosomonas sp. HPC101]|nr:hypothetical protein [Nitrosomonas sp. HPC101]